MSDKEKFIPGLYFNLPREGAPEYVKGSVNIDLEKFLPWAIERAKSDPKLRTDLKVSQEGKAYAQVNEWKPKGDAPQRAAKAAPAPAGDIDDFDLPF